MGNCQNWQVKYCIRHVNYPYEDSGVSSIAAGAPASVGGFRQSHDQQRRDKLRPTALQGGGICLAAGFLIHQDLEEGRLVSPVAGIPAGRILDERGLSAPSSSLRQGPYLYRHAGAS